MGGDLPRWHHRGPQRLVDRPRAGLRHRADATEGGVRRPAAPRPARRGWRARRARRRRRARRSRRAPRRLAADGERAERARRTVARRRDRRGRPVHDPVHERDDRAAEGCDALAPQPDRDGGPQPVLACGRGRAQRRRAAFSAEPARSGGGVAVLPHLGHGGTSRHQRELRDDVGVPAGGPLGPDRAPGAHRPLQGVVVVGRAHAVLAHPRAPRLRLLRRQLGRRSELGRRAVRAGAHAIVRPEDARRDPVERLRHDRVDGRGHPADRAAATRTSSRRSAARGRAWRSRSATR